MDRIDLLRRHSAIRRLSRANPLSTAELRLGLIQKCVEGDEEVIGNTRKAIDIAYAARNTQPSVEARELRGGKNRQERDGLNRKA